MTHYSPGAGLKKPLNMMELPVFPDIKKGPPRFVNSKKHWMVDAGAAMRDTEPFTQLYENAVLAQSKDYNKTVYGQSSHRDIVNAEFRPPLQSPYEDFGPLSRLPCTIHAIVPRINPGTAFDSGSYEARNQRPSDIEGKLTDRLKDAGGWRPTFFAPMDAPIDNAVLPDLEIKLPPIAVHAGWNIPYKPQELGPPADLNLKEKASRRIDTGYASNVMIEGQSSLENYQARMKLPTYSADAGMNTPYTVHNTSHLEGFELESKMPSYSVGSGTNTLINVDGERVMPELVNKRPYYAVSSGITSKFEYGNGLEMKGPTLVNKMPSYSVGAGSNTLVNMDAPHQEYTLTTKMPTYSVGAGTNTLVMIDAPTNPDQSTLDRVEKNTRVPLGVVNVGFEDHTPVGMNEMDASSYIDNRRPNYSYEVPHEIPTYREQNEKTYQPHFQEKLQAEKTYGSIAQSSGYIPRYGIEQPTMKFRGGGKTAQKMGYVKKSPTYRI